MSPGATACESCAPGASPSELGVAPEIIAGIRRGRGHAAAAQSRRHRLRHGMFLICSGDGSVMFVFRWYITHSDPDSVITTSTIMKISDIHVQPPSAFDVM